MTTTTVHSGLLPRTSSKPHLHLNTKPLSRISTTAPLTTFTTRPRSCYLCDEQNPGDFSPTTTRLSACQLCNRDFCPIHQSVGKQSSSICNINHSRYYHERLEQARQRIAVRRRRNGDGPGDRLFDEGEAEETLIRAGVYPSLGEKQKMVWTSSPVSPERMKEIENFRSLDAEHRGTKGRSPSMLIETKEVVGADVAV